MPSSQSPSSASWSWEYLPCAEDLPRTEESDFPSVTMRWRPLCPEKKAASSFESESGGSVSMALKCLMASWLAAGPERRFADGEAMLPSLGQLTRRFATTFDERVGLRDALT